MKPTYLFVLLLLTFNLAIGQKTKNKKITVPEINFPKLSLVKGIDTYSVEVLNKSNESYGAITKGEILSLLDLQSFKVDEESPKMFFGIKGISHKQLTINTKRSKATKQYTLSISPNLDASIKIISIINGVSTHYFQIPIVAKKSKEQAVIPEILTISFEDQDYYMDFVGEDRFEVKPALIDKYLVSLYGSKEKLINVLISKIRKTFDLRVDREQTTYTFLKDKKKPELEEETVNSILALEEDLKDVKSLDDLTEKKEQIKKFQDFWKQKLEMSLAEGKSNAKTSWHIAKNLYDTSYLLKDIDAFDSYYQQIVDLDTRKMAMYFLKTDYKHKNESLIKHINNDSGEIIYGENYEVNPLLAKIEANNQVAKFSKDNDLNKVEGYIITAEGEKIEGKISLKFSPPEKTKGNIVNLDASEPGKSLTLFKLNEKGKLKGKNYKTKKIQKFVVNEKTYEPVRIKKDLGSELDMSDLGLNNSYFMELLYSNEKFKIYKNLTNLGVYQYKGKEDKKAIKLNNKNLEAIFGSCENTKKIIEKEDFKYVDDTILNLGKLYSESCN